MNELIDVQNLCDIYFDWAEIVFGNVRIKCSIDNYALLMNCPKCSTLHR